MASEGPNIPGTGAESAASGAILQWTNINNILAADANTAICGDESSDETSYWLKGTNYGFGLPSGATVDGIEVELYQIDTIGGASPDSNVLALQMIVGGVLTGDDKGDGWQVLSTPSNRTYGGATDPWGLTIDDTDVNATDFGIALRVAVNRNDFIDISTMQITMHYTASGGGGGSTTLNRHVPRWLGRGLVRGKA